LFFSPKIGKNRRKSAKIAENRQKSPKIVIITSTAGQGGKTPFYAENPGFKASSSECL
jgi:hypothetical protein